MSDALPLNAAKSKWRPALPAGVRRFCSRMTYPMRRDAGSDLRTARACLLLE
jgi:hypothetical protein